MHTLCLPMCSIVGPMARGGGGDITGNGPGQGFTTHQYQRLNPLVQDVSGAPTLWRRRAADGRRREFVTTKRYTPRLSHMTKLHRHTPHTLLSVPAKLGCVAQPSSVPFGGIVATHLVIQPFVIVNVQTTRETSRTRSSALGILGRFALSA